ncbi:hypothetical protein IFM89_038657, partial [Coptis chinensis]
GRTSSVSQLPTYLNGPCAALFTSLGPLVFCSFWWLGNKIGHQGLGASVQPQALLNTTTKKKAKLSIVSCCDMPEDVVYLILLCLPVISLLRFKSVCKSWCSLIQSSNFIAQHLNYRSTFKENYNGNLIIFHCQRKADYPRFPYSVDVNLFTDEKLEESLNLDLPYYCDRRGKYVDHRGDDNGSSIINLKMVASLDGIICLHHRESDEILLWNPAIKQLRLLPEGMLHPSRRRTHVGVHLGIGFDVKTNEYKVVRILLDDLNHTCRVEVYSLSTDSWRIINTDLPCDCFFSDPKAPLKSEIYCWLVRISNQTQDYCDSILTFDFSNELFGTIPLPDVCSIRYDVGSQLDIISGKIACICRKFSPVSSDTESCSSHNSNSTCHLDIWVLDKYGVKESWTKLYTIGPFSMFSPMGVLKNGELILLANNHGLFLCNPLTQEIKNIQVQGRPIQSQWSLHVASYKESLVSIEKWNGAANIEAFAGSHFSSTLP